MKAHLLLPLLGAATLLAVSPPFAKKRKAQEAQEAKDASRPRRRGSRATRRGRST